MRGQQYSVKLGFDLVTMCLGITLRDEGISRSKLAMSFSASAAVLLSSLAALLSFPASFCSPFTLAEACLYLRSTTHNDVTIPDHSVWFY